ncbi:MAG: hypothetical protein SFU86_09730 [Pirellulaceae bacterium]|nr:hypothetical protein [Pirellulaceae bacterium]
MSGGTGGSLFLSIDLELDISSPSFGQVERLDEVRSWLVEETRDLGLPATWGVADPRLSAATESILSAGVGHEVAVLGDQSWLGPGAGRLRLDRELARRFDAARRAGIAVSTLALKNVPQTPDLALLLRHGITALRGPAVDTAGAARKLGSPPTRFGIWQTPAPWRITPQHPWWSLAGWQLDRQLRRCGREKSLLHLELDAQSLVPVGPDAFDNIRAIFRRVARERQAGRVEILTIRQFAAAELTERWSHPSRSVLRPAA